MQFSLFGFKMNDACDYINFTHLTQLLLQHYLVKIRKSKHQKCMWTQIQLLMLTAKYMHQITVTAS